MKTKNISADNPSRKVMPTIKKKRMGQGISWVGEGLSRIKNAPFTWIGISFVICTIALGVGNIPYLQVTIIPTVAVLMSGIFIAENRYIENGRPISIVDIFLGLSNQLLPLLKLGILHSILLLIAIVLPSYLTMEVFSKYVTELDQGVIKERVVDLILADPMLWVSVFLSIVLPVTVLISVIFAYPLVAIYNTDILEALKKSLFASVKNRGAITIYILTMLSLIMAMLLVGISVFELTSSGENAIGITFALVSFVLIMSVTFVVSTGYPIFRDIFEEK